MLNLIQIVFVRLSGELVEKWPHTSMSMTVNLQILKNSTDRMLCWNLRGNKTTPSRGFSKTLHSCVAGIAVPLHPYNTRLIEYSHEIYKVYRVT